MNLTIDTKVIFLLLGIGYLFTLILLIAYEYKHIKNLITNTFFFAKFTQTIAWFCQILRGENLDFLSISFANSLLFISYTFEIIALLELKQPLHKKNKIIYFVFTFLSIIGFQVIFIFFNEENLRIVFYSFVNAVIYFSAFRVVFGKEISLLMRIMGSMYIIFATASLIRGIISMIPVTPTFSTSLFTPGTLQLIILLSLFIFTNLGTIGYILLMKQKVDQELFYFASHDDLTQILNRRTFTESAKQFLINYAKKGQSISFILFDIDNFKKINDTFGHLVGDKVLQDLTIKVKQHLDKDDLFGRYGGDEFGIFMPGKNVEDSTKTAERIKLSLNDDKCSLPLTYTISMGIITIIPNHSTQLEMLYTNCDKALYMAKNNGRNGIYRVQC